MPNDRPRARWDLPVLLLLALGLRTAVLAAPRADLLGESRTGAERIAHGEELARGNIAIEVLEGPIQPLLDYQWTTFAGGSLVVGLAAAPLFALLGPNLVALKLVPVAFAGLAVVFAFLVLDRAAGRRAAWIGGLLLALAPPGHTVMSCVALGEVMELGALVLVALYVFLGMWTGERAGNRDALVLGLVCGFGLWFGYGFTVPIACFGLLALVRDKLFLLDRRAAFGALGFAVGFAPWGVYNLRHDLAGFTVYGKPLASRLAFGRRLPDLPERTAELFGGDLPASLFLRGPGPLQAPQVALILTVLLLAAVLAALVQQRASLGAALHALVRRRARADSIAPALVPVVLLAFLVAAHLLGVPRDAGEERDAMRIRHVIALQPFLLVAAAIGIDGLARRGAAARRVPLAILAALLAVFAAGNLDLIRPARLGAAWEQPATRREAFGRWLVLRFPGDLERWRGLVPQLETRRSPETRAVIYAGAGETLRFVARPLPGRKPRERKEAQAQESVRSWLEQHVPPPNGASFRAGGDG